MTKSLYGEIDGDRVLFPCNSDEECKSLLFALYSACKGNYLSLKVYKDDKIVVVVDNCPEEIKSNTVKGKVTDTGLEPITVEDNVPFPDTRVVSDTFLFKGGKYKDMGFSAIIIQMGWDELPNIYASWISFKNEDNKAMLLNDVKTYFSNNVCAYGEIKNINTPFDIFRDFFLCLYDSEKVSEAMSKTTFVADFNDLESFEDETNIKKIISDIKLSM